MHTGFPRYTIKCYFCKNIQFSLCPCILWFSLSRNHCDRCFVSPNRFNPPPLWFAGEQRVWLSQCLCGFLSVSGVPAWPPSISLSLLSSEILYLSPPDLPACLTSGHLLYFCSLLADSHPCPIGPWWLVIVWSTSTPLPRGSWDPHIPSTRGTDSGAGHSWHFNR